MPFNVLRFLKKGFVKLSVVKRLGVFVAVVILLLVAMGCGRKIVELPPLPKEEEEVQVTLYAPAADGLIAVDRKILKKDNKPEKVVRELIRTKNAPPSRDPYKPFLPLGTKILSIKVKDGLATVNFSREVLNVKGDQKMQRYALAAIVKTLTQFPNIKMVGFQVEGREKGKIDGRNIEDWWGEVTLREQPWQ